MEQNERRFVERMARMAEEEGLPRIAGHLLGYLLIHEGRHSLDEMAAALDVSKASVSTNARLLERVGFARRVTVPGDRRDYYMLVPKPWEHMFAVVRRRMRHIRDVLEEGLETLPPENEAGRERLEEWRGFYGYLLAGLEARIAEWRGVHPGANGGVGAAGGRSGARSGES